MGKSQKKSQITARNAGGRAGFTLIEVLIYFGLFSFVMGGMLFTVYGIIEGAGKTQSGTILNEEGIFITKKLDWALSGATAIDVSSPDKAKITKASLPTNENPLIFTVSSGNLMLSRGTAEPVQLNSESVKIGEMVFTGITSGEGETVGLTAEFTLEYFLRDRSFDITRYLR